VLSVASTMIISRSAVVLVSVLAGLLSACTQVPVRTGGVTPGTPVARHGDEISVCGRLFRTGTRVVLWNDPNGYDAYRVEPKFPDELGSAEPPKGARYGSFRRKLDDSIADSVHRRGWTLDELRATVQHFVLHYDVCGTSRRCFKVLQDRRGLSVHFMLDVDGTIYQTLDLKERAWHAGTDNDHSIGIEIANIGAYPSPDHEVLKSWYQRDESGVRIVFPDTIKDTGILTPNFVPRPARDEIIEGEIQGRKLYQYDFTNEQYQALAKVAATLSRVFPRIRLQYPVGEDGELIRKALGSDELARFEGLIGHYHVTKRKIDPGPAFDWDRLIRGARAALGD